MYIFLGRIRNLSAIPGNGPAPGPDPHQNEADPKHCLKVNIRSRKRTIRSRKWTVKLRGGVKQPKSYGKNMYFDGKQICEIC